MILGEPTFQMLIELIGEVGCPRYGELPGTIFVDGPSEIILVGCGHVVDARGWIDQRVGGN